MGDVDRPSLGPLEDLRVGLETRWSAWLGLRNDELLLEVVAVSRGAECDRVDLGLRRDREANRLPDPNRPRAWEETEPRDCTAIVRRHHVVPVCLEAGKLLCTFDRAHDLASGLRAVSAGG